LHRQSNLLALKLCLSLGAAMRRPHPQT